MVEGSEVSFVCPICGESDFSEKSIFLRHLKIHEVKTAKICDISRKFCDVCGKTYPNVLVYNDHVRKYHLHEYPCNQCHNIRSKEKRFFKIIKYVKNQDKSDLTIFNSKKVLYYK